MHHPRTALAMETWLPWLLSLAAVGAGLPGQSAPAAPDLPRRTTVGTVLGSDGPLANATVHFLYRPRGTTSGPAADAVTVTTDTRGRYRAKLWSGTKYCAWAIAPDQAQSASASNITWTDVAAVEEFRVDVSTPAAIVQLEGLRKWADTGPFTVRWLVAGIPIPGEPTTVNTTKPAPLENADEAPWLRVPPLPATRCTGEVCDARGEVIDHFRHLPADPKPRKKVDPPREVPLLATTDAGVPLAGVEVTLRISTTWGSGDLYAPQSANRYAIRRLGTTDAEGRLIAKVASRSDPMQASGWQQITLLANKAGFATCHAGFRREPFTNGAEIERKDLEVLKLVMRPAAPLRGEVLGAGNAGVPFVIATDAFIASKKNSGFINDYLHYEIETDSEGRFEIAGLPHQSKRAFLLPRPHASTLTRLDERDQRTAPPNLLMFHPRPIAVDDGRATGTQWNLDHAKLLRLQIIDRNRGPATGTRVMFLSRRGDLECSWWTPTATPDRAGRLTVRLEEGEWFVFARNQRSMAHASVDTKTTRELKLELSPMPAMTGRVVNDQGQPVPFASLDCHSSTYRSINERPDLEVLASSLNWRWLDSVHADAEGRFHCAFIDLPHMYYEARFKHGKQQSAEFKVVADEEPHTIVVPSK